MEARTTKLWIDSGLEVPKQEDSMSLGQIIWQVNKVFRVLNCRLSLDVKMGAHASITLPTCLSMSFVEPLHQHVHPMFGTDLLHLPVRLTFPTEPLRPYSTPTS